MNRRLLTFVLAVVLALAALLPVTGALAWSPDEVVFANTDPDLYTIKVDLTNKVVTVYERVDNDPYAKIARQSICTTGTNSDKTPTGKWRLDLTRRRFGYFSKYNCYAQYWVHVVGGIYFHSILYNTPVEGDFTSTSYRALGTQASHGCIRMLVEDVRWLYYNCPPGTLCIVEYGEKDEELRQSLLPAQSAKEYWPEDDEYEAEDRPAPVGVATSAVKLMDSNGKYLKTVQRGSIFEILLSGTPSTKVRLEDGSVGYIENEYIYFIPNGPGEGLVEEYTTTTDVKVYERPNNTLEPIDVLPEGSKLTLLDGETKSFYHVRCGDTEGYLLKRYVEYEQKLPKEAQKAVDAGDDELTMIVTRIKDEDAYLYPTTSTRSEPLGHYGKGTDLEILSETVYFYRVKLDGMTGYVAKRDTANYRVDITDGYEPQVFRIEDEPVDEEKPEDEDIGQNSDDGADVELD